MASSVTNHLGYQLTDFYPCLLHISPISRPVFRLQSSVSALACGEIQTSEILPTLDLWDADTHMSPLKSLSTPWPGFPAAPGTSCYTSWPKLALL